MNDIPWAAVAAIAVALISLVSSLRLSRQNGRINAELTRAQAASEFRDQQLLKHLKAIDEVIRSIQKLKDSIYMIVHSSPESFSCDAAITNLSGARQAMFTAYERWHPHMEKEADEASHKAKNVAWTLETLVRRALASYTWTSQLPEEQRGQLVEIRVKLTELQDALRDIKDTATCSRLAEHEEKNPSGA